MSNWIPQPSATAMWQRNSGGQPVAEIVAERKAALDRGNKQVAKAKEGTLVHLATRPVSGGMTLSEMRRSMEAAKEYQQIRKDRRASLGRNAAAGAAGAVLAGALTLGLMKLLSKKKKTNNGGQSRKEIRRTTRLGPGGLAYKKGGVAKKRNSKQMKKKAVKKAVHKAVHKKAGKR